MSIVDKQSPISATTELLSSFTTSSLSYPPVSVVTAVFCINLISRFSLGFLPLPVLEEDLWDKRHRFLAGRMLLLASNQQCESTEGNTEHSPLPVA